MKQAIKLFKKLCKKEFTDNIVLVVDDIDDVGEEILAKSKNITLKYQNQRVENADLQIKQRIEDTFEVFSDYAQDAYNLINAINRIYLLQNIASSETLMSYFTALARAQQNFLKHISQEQQQNIMDKVDKLAANLNVIPGAHLLVDEKTKKILFQKKHLQQTICDEISKICNEANLDDMLKEQRLLLDPNYFIPGEVPVQLLRPSFKNSLDIYIHYSAFGLGGFESAKQRVLNSVSDIEIPKLEDHFTDPNEWIDEFLNYIASQTLQEFTETVAYKKIPKNLALLSTLFLKLCNPEEPKEIEEAPAEIKKMIEQFGGAIGLDSNEVKEYCDNPDVTDLLMYEPLAKYNDEPLIYETTAEGPKESDKYTKKILIVRAPNGKCYNILEMLGFLESNNLDPTAKAAGQDVKILDGLQNIKKFEAMVKQSTLYKQFPNILRDPEDEYRAEKEGYNPKNVEFFPQLFEALETLKSQYTNPPYVQYLYDYGKAYTQIYAAGVICHGDYFENEGFPFALAALGRLNEAIDELPKEVQKEFYDLKNNSGLTLKKVMASLGETCIHGIGFSLLRIYFTSLHTAITYIRNKGFEDAEEPVCGADVLANSEELSNLLKCALAPGVIILSNDVFAFYGMQLDKEGGRGSRETSRELINVNAKFVRMQKNKGMTDGIPKVGLKVNVMERSVIGSTHHRRYGLQYERDINRQKFTSYYLMTYVAGTGLTTSPFYKQNFIGEYYMSASIMESRSRVVHPMNGTFPQPIKNPWNTFYSQIDNELYDQRVAHGEDPFRANDYEIDYENPNIPRQFQELLEEQDESTENRLMVEWPIKLLNSLAAYNGDLYEKGQVNPYGSYHKHSTFPVESERENLIHTIFDPKGLLGGDNAKDYQVLTDFLPTNQITMGGNFNNLLVTMASLDENFLPPDDKTLTMLALPIYKTAGISRDTLSEYLEEEDLDKALIYNSLSGRASSTKGVIIANRPLFAPSRHTEDKCWNTVQEVEFEDDVLISRIAGESISANDGDIFPRKDDAKVHEFDFASASFKGYLSVDRFAKFDGKSLLSYVYEKIESSVGFGMLIKNSVFEGVGHPNSSWEFANFAARTIYNNVIQQNVRALFDQCDWVNITDRYDNTKLSKEFLDKFPRTKDNDRKDLREFVGDHIASRLGDYKQVDYISAYSTGKVMFPGPTFSETRAPLAKQRGYNFQNTFNLAFTKIYDPEWTRATPKDGYLSPDKNESSFYYKFKCVTMEGLSILSTEDIEDARKKISVRFSSATFSDGNCGILQNLISSYSGSYDSPGVKSYDKAGKVLASLINSPTSFWVRRSCLLSDDLVSNLSALPVNVQNIMIGNVKAATVGEPDASPENLQKRGWFPDDLRGVNLPKTAQDIPLRKGFDMHTEDSSAILLIQQMNNFDSSPNIWNREEINDHYTLSALGKVISNFCTVNGLWLYKADPQEWNEKGFANENSSTSFYMMDLNSKESRFAFNEIGKNILKFLNTNFGSGKDNSDQYYKMFNVDWTDEIFKGILGQMHVDSNEKTPGHRLAKDVFSDFLSELPSQFDVFSFANDSPGLVKDKFNATFGLNSWIRNLQLKYQGQFNDANRFFVGDEIDFDDELLLLQDRDLAFKNSLYILGAIKFALGGVVASYNDQESYYCLRESNSYNCMPFHSLEIQSNYIGSGNIGVQLGFEKNDWESKLRFYADTSLTKTIPDKELTDLNEIFPGALLDANLIPYNDTNLASSVNYIPGFNGATPTDFQVNFYNPSGWDFKYGLEDLMNKRKLDLAFFERKLGDFQTITTSVIGQINIANKLMGLVQLCNLIAFKPISTPDSISQDARPCGMQVDSAVPRNILNQGVYPQMNQELFDLLEVDYADIYKTIDNPKPKPRVNSRRRKTKKGKCAKYRKTKAPKCNDQEGCEWVVGKGCVEK